MNPCKGSPNEAMCSINLLEKLLHTNHSDTTPGPINGKSKIISDRLAVVLEILFYIVGCGIFSIAGSVANVINSIVFYRQGILTDSSNVSLFGLALSDLCCLVTLLWMTIASSIVMSEPKGWNWVPKDIMLLTGALPHVIFSQVTCWITAYISFERCMCVVFPFKMRTLFTPKRSAVIVSFFLVYNFASYTPLFMTQSLRWMKDPDTNTTKLVAHNNELYDSMQALDNYLNSFANRLLPVAIVLICTCITAVKVNASKRFRKQVAGIPTSTTKSTDAGNKEVLDKKSSNSGSSSSQKENKLVRMILTISSIFLICYSSDIVMVIFKYLLPEIQHNGTYHNTFHFTLSLQFFLESVNSSINILVYYNLSSRYKQEFKKLFRFQT